MKQPPSTRQCSQNIVVLAQKGSQLTPSILDASYGFLQQIHPFQKQFARKVSQLQHGFAELVQWDVKSRSCQDECFAACESVG